MQTPQILRELDQLARASKWPGDELARRLGLDRSTLANLRSGRKRISLTILSQILVTFASVPAIPGLVLHYLSVELRERKWGMLPLATPTENLAGLREGLPTALAEEIGAYATRFPSLAVEAKGLFIVADDTSILMQSVQLLLAEFEQRGVRVLRLVGNAKPSPVEQQAALAMPLLVVERIDALSAAMLDLLTRRGDLLRPMVVTSVTDMERISDAYLRRICRSLMRRVSTDPVTAPAA